MEVRHDKDHMYKAAQTVGRDCASFQKKAVTAERPSCGVVERYSDNTPQAYKKSEQTACSDFLLRNIKR